MLNQVQKIIGKPSDFQPSLLPSKDLLSIVGKPENFKPSLFPKFETCIHFNIFWGSEMIGSKDLEKIAEVFISGLNKIKIKYINYKVVDDFVKLKCDVSYEVVKEYLQNKKIEYKGKELTARNFTYYTMNTTNAMNTIKKPIKSMLGKMKMNSVV